MELAEFFSKENLEKANKKYLKSFKVFVIGKGVNILGRTIGGYRTFDADLLKAKGWTLIPTDEDPLNLKEGYKSCDTWTCACEKDFVHSAMINDCSKCGCTLLNETKRLKSFEGIVGGWGGIVI